MNDSSCAFTATVTATGFGVGLAEENKPGYWPCPQYGTFATWDEAFAKARELNQARDMNEETAIRIVCSSMRSQNVRGKRGR